MVSVPIANVLKPEATATADPVEDPPGADSSQCNFRFAMCLETYGDWHWPPTADQPGGIDGFLSPQNSVRFALPIMIIPRRINRSTMVAFFLGIHPTKAYDPAVQSCQHTMRFLDWPSPTHSCIHTERVVGHDVILNNNGDSMQRPSNLTPCSFIVQLLRQFE